MNDPFDIKNHEPDLGIEVVGVGKVGGSSVAASSAAQVAAPLFVPTQKIEGNLYDCYEPELRPITPFGLADWRAVYNAGGGTYLLTFWSMTNPTPDRSIRIITDIRWELHLEMTAGQKDITSWEARAFVTSDDGPIYMIYLRDFATIYSPLAGNKYLDRTGFNSNLRIATRENSSIGILIYLTLNSGGPGLTSSLNHIDLSVLVNGLQIRQEKQIGRGKNFRIDSLSGLPWGNRVEFMNTIINKYQELS